MLEHTRCWRVVGARTVAIEPVLSAYEALLDNVHLNRINEEVVAYNLALGDGPGDGYVTAGLDTRNRVVKDPHVLEEVEQVGFARLDDLLEGRDCPAYIKIDVEGYETAVVSGATGTFSKPELGAVIMEANRSGETFGFDDSELQRRMVEEFGFARYEYDPLKRRLIHLHSGRVHPGENAIYVRNPESVRKRVREANAVSVMGKRL